MLESLALIKVLHSVDQFRHQLTAILFIKEFLTNGIPKLIQSLLSVGGEDLLISSSQIQSHLSSLEPFLDGSFTLHKLQVGLESLLLDS